MSNLSDSVQPQTAERGGETRLGPRVLKTRGGARHTRVLDAATSGTERYEP